MRGKDGVQLPLPQLLLLRRWRRKQLPSTRHRVIESCLTAKRELKLSSFYSAALNISNLHWMKEISSVPEEKQQHFSILHEVFHVGGSHGSFPNIYLIQEIAFTPVL